jgi:hypothetical protein
MAHKTMRTITLHAPSHVFVARPVLKMVVLVMGLLSGTAIGGGIVAIIWNAVSPTSFNILGATVTTGHVGVAFAALGLITMLFVVRAVLNYTHKLAALPEERHDRLGVPHIYDREMLIQNGISSVAGSDVERIVQEAIDEARVKAFSRIPFRPRQQTFEGGLVLREYFGTYLGRLIRHLRAAEGTRVKDVAAHIDTFLSKTWMNHLLDSWVDTYVLRDYLEELNRIANVKGCPLNRLPQKRIDELAEAWGRIGSVPDESEIDRGALDSVIATLPPSL